MPQIGTKAAPLRALVQFENAEGVG